ncbi:unnamed protein product [Brachionus calyciflorus]|uniref:Metalloproteinase n=1 Tax=Brachionus calyciflorus TaxID=104777 RepID=A0A813PM93_9BILA|nr:unnamed protein product [Brachionus calyciflorus]
MNHLKILFLLNFLILFNLSFGLSKSKEDELKEFIVSLARKHPDLPDHLWKDFFNRNNDGQLPASNLNKSLSEERTGPKANDQIVKKRRTSRSLEISYPEYFIAGNDYKLPYKLDQPMFPRPFTLDLEILIVTDLTILNDFQTLLNTTDKTKIFSYMRIYYSHLINSVNQLFKRSLNNDPDLRINLRVVDFFLFEYVDELYWTSYFVAGDEIRYFNGREVLNSRYSLNAFKVFMNNLKIPFEYDLAIGFLNKDLWYDLKDIDQSMRSSQRGASYLGSICSNYRVALIEDDGGFSNMYTLARHILHSLGVNYDSNSCSNNFLMSQVNSTSNNGLFSLCTIHQLKAILLNNQNNSPRASCLIRTGDRLADDFNYVNQNGYSIGQVWDADQQCKLRLGPQASFCQIYYNEMCSTLYCRESLSSRTCIPTTAAGEGTVCGYKSACKAGKCEESLQVTASECPFGDDYVRNGVDPVKYNGNLVTCKEYFSDLSRLGYSIDGFCNSNDGLNSCCQSCSKYRALDCSDKAFICPSLKDYCQYVPWLHDSCPKSCKKCTTTPITCNLIDNSPCLNGAICSYSENEPDIVFRFKCVCRPGYYGEYCEKSKNILFPVDFGST